MIVRGLVQILRVTEEVCEETTRLARFGNRLSCGESVGVFSNQNTSDWSERHPASHSLERSSLSDVKHGLYDDQVSQGMSIKEMIRAPSRRIPLWLRNNLSPTTSRRSTLKSKKTVSIILRMSRKSTMGTFAGHIDDQIDIDIQITRRGVVHARLEIRPAPNEFANIIRDEMKAIKRVRKPRLPERVRIVRCRVWEKRQNS